MTKFKYFDTITIIIFNLSPRRFELLYIPHQEIILPMKL